MIHLSDIRYVRLGTRDLEGSTAYATKVLGLEIAHRTSCAVYFRSDSRDHTLCYFEGDPADHTSAFEVADATSLRVAADVLEKSGMEPVVGTSDQCEMRHVRDLVRFKDPSGNKIELVVAPHQSGRRYFPSRDAGISGFSHIGLRSKDPTRDEKFWTELCSARVSDWIGDAPLLRIDEVHHKIALFPSTFAGVQHINHQVESIDDLMRSYYLLREQGIRILFGPGRHPTSGAMFLYFEGPDGMIYEYSTGVRTFTAEEEASYRPRQFPSTFSSFCMWGAKPDIPEFKA